MQHYITYDATCIPMLLMIIVEVKEDCEILKIQINSNNQVKIKKLKIC